MNNCSRSDLNSVFLSLTKLFIKICPCVCSKTRISSLGHWTQILDGRDVALEQFILIRPENFNVSQVQSDTTVNMINTKSEFTLGQIYGNMMPSPSPTVFYAH